MTAERRSGKDRRLEPGCVCGKALCSGDCGLPWGTHFYHHGDRSPMTDQKCKEFTRNLYKYIDATLNRRSEMERRKGTA